MAVLSVSPNVVYGNQIVELACPAGSGVDLTRTARVLLLQRGVGGAMNVILQFTPIDATRLQASVPPVATGFTANAIAQGVYEVVVQLPGRELRGNVPITVRSGTAPTPTPPAIAPSPGAGATPASPLTPVSPPPGGSFVGPSSLLSLRTALVSSAGRNISVALGAPTHLNPTAPSASPSATPGAGGCDCCACNCHCCCDCRPRCCCSCSCKGNHATATPTATGVPPGTSVPPASGSSRLPRVFPPAPTFAAGGPPGGGSGVEQVEEAMKVRWLVESANPIRTGAGPELIDTSSDPSLYSDSMSGTTPNGGKIPVEPVVGTPAAAANPPVRQYDFIVSSQLLSPGDHPIPGQKITFRWLDAPGTPRNDDSVILEVSNDRAALKRKLVDQAEPARNEYAYADTDGKAYAWIRVRLFDAEDVPDFDQRLKGLKAIIGEAVKPPRVATGTGLHSIAPGSTTTTAAAADAATRTRQQRSLLNILVEHGEAAVESFGEWVNGQLEAFAGIPRTFQQVLGFALKRIADGVILMFPLPAYSVALLNGFEDELRAMVIGLLMGVPRGLYAMARDTIMDLKMIAIDLPRALFNFFADDPKFALEVVASIASTTAATVIYNLDPEFRDRINKALSKFKGFLENAATIIGLLWSAMRDHLTLSGITSMIGRALYSDFEELVGPIATEYLVYARNGDEYRYFVGGFMGGDVLGYVLATVGVELLLAWFTAGIGNIVAGLSKFGRLGAIAGRLAEILHKLLTFFRAIGDQISEFAAAAARTVKNGIGAVILGLFKVLERFVEPLAEHLAVPFFEALLELAEAIQRRVSQMVFRLGEDISEQGKRLVFLADSFIGEILNGPPTRQLKEFMADYLEVMSHAIARDKDSFVYPHLCECRR